MCSDAQLWMAETKANTREENAAEVLEFAAPAGDYERAEPIPVSKPGIGRAAAVFIGVARAGVSLIRLLRQGGKGRAGAR